MPADKRTDIVAVVAFDVGIRQCGWCRSLVPRIGRATHLRSGMCASEYDDILAVIQEAQRETEEDVEIVVAVERVILSRIGAAKNLIALSEVVGLIRGIVASETLPCVWHSAPEWRKALGLGGQPSNAAVHQCVRLRYAQWPNKSNNHHRDAGGLGLAAGLAYLADCTRGIVTNTKTA